MQMQTLESLIEDAFERRADLTQNEIEGSLREVSTVMEPSLRRTARPAGRPRQCRPLC